MNVPPQWKEAKRIRILQSFFSPFQPLVLHTEPPPPPRTFLSLESACFRNLMHYSLQQRWCPARSIFIGTFWTVNLANNWCISGPFAGGERYLGGLFFTDNSAYSAILSTRFFTRFFSTIDNNEEFMKYIKGVKIKRSMGNMGWTELAEKELKAKENISRIQT